MTAHTTRRWRVQHADCLTLLPTLECSSVDVVITDPPYGISFAGMGWDVPRRLDPGRPPGRRRSAASESAAFQAFSTAWAEQALRVLKPGGHLAAFAAPRTAHLLACGLEQAGFEIRDTLMWIQGQGYPASRNLPGGWGTGLKPAYEPIILARRPLDGTLQANHAAHGTGALNIEACRIPDTPPRCAEEGRRHGPARAASERGRWPANLFLSHDPICTPTRCATGCPVGLLGDRQRFFYTAKASRRERDAGCEQLPRRTTQTFKIGAAAQRRARARPVANLHPTVKPIELMRWLVRLLTPAGGLVLDPFTGSGSTGAAAVLEGARFLGIEREADYILIARARISHWDGPAQHLRRGRAARPD
jgi:DNA modification methylase